jgi:hypothetical protein
MNFIHSIFLGLTVSSPLGLSIPWVQCRCYTAVTPVDKTRDFSLPVKIQGDAYSPEISASKYDNQIARHPQTWSDKGLKIKNSVCN